MPILVGKDSVSVTINYYKGNPFTQEFIVSGIVPPTYAIAKISRIGDPDKESIITFSGGSGLTIVSQTITLAKTAQQMLLPPGQYELSLEATISGVSRKLLDNSYLVVADSINQALTNSASIVATAISGTEVNVVWSAIAGANQYTLRRSLDGLVWSVIYTGPNTNFSDTGLTPLTLYYYDVSGSGPGMENSPLAQTNATTLAAATGAEYFLPEGGVDGQYLRKNGPTPGVATWANFPSIPTYDGSETKVGNGANVTVTGTGTIADPYIINATGGGGSLPAGGTIGQILTKDSDLPGAASWQDPPTTPEQIIALGGNMYS